MQQAGAQYLLRFDDLCPGMDEAKWQRYLPLLERYRLKPIVAIIPENRDALIDPEMAACGSSASVIQAGVENRRTRDAAFWKQMRSLVAAGAEPALHGYRHLCAANGRSLVPLHRVSEFAGVDEERQRRWIDAGLSILRSHGLEPRIWVAPRHGFDRTTLNVLKSAGILLVSDGFAMRPFKGYGMIWLPQQLWAPVEKHSGLWTICLHAGTASDEEVGELGEFLQRFAGQFKSVSEVLNEWPIGRRSIQDRLFEAQNLGRIFVSNFRRRLLC